MSTQAQKTFTISRKEAADLLKVSTRTLDRYIKSKKVSSKSIAGRIMLNEEELKGMTKKRTHRKISNKNKVQKSEKVFEINSPVIEKKNDEQAVEEKVYKKLYEELKVEARTYQQRLEGANYRVGQLEAEVKVSVPLLDHQKLLTENKKEKYNKKVLYILLGITLVLQPLWLLLAYF